MDLRPPPAQRSALEGQRVRDPGLHPGAGGGPNPLWASQAPTLAPLPPLEEELERAIDPDRVPGQPPVELPHHPQALRLANAHRLLLGHPHPAHLGGAPGLEGKGLSNGPLGELDLQFQGLEQHRTWRLTDTTATSQRQGQHDDQGHEPAQ